MIRFLNQALIKVFALVSLLLVVLLGFSGAASAGIVNVAPKAIDQTTKINTGVDIVDVRYRSRRGYRRFGHRHRYRYGHRRLRLRFGHHRPYRYSYRRPYRYYGYRGKRYGHRRHRIRRHYRHRHIRRHFRRHLRHW